MRTFRSAIKLTAAILLFFTLVTPAQAAAPSAPSDLRVGGFPGRQIWIAWTDNSTNENNFQLERSINNRTGYSLLTTLAANTLVYTDTSVLADTTYWYRVRACNGDGCSAYSKDSFNVSFEVNAVPNLDERYMLFLVNDARGDPTTYGYSSYSPRPPVAYNALLNDAAHSHSQAILNSDFTIGHCYPDPQNSQPDTEYRCPSERARDVGYLGGVSENLIAGGNGWDATRGAFQAFMDSSGHRDNLMDPNAKEAGMGHAFDPHKGSTWHGQYTHTFCGWNPVTLPALPSGIVVPYWGRATTVFSFLVNFYNSSGTGPTQARVVIDGVPHAMTIQHGTAANGSYLFTTTLAKGSHTYYFDFQYGSGQSARLPTSGVYSGPDVEVGAAVLDVPSEYPTVADALSNAVGDVIVQLAAGTFNETTTLSVPTNGIWIQGAGVDQTIIHGSGSGHVFDISLNARVRDLTITGGGTGYFESAVWNTAGQVELRDCRLTGNNVGVFTWCFSPSCGAVVTLNNCVLDHNARAAVDANEYGVHYLTNNTIVANGRGVILNNSASRAENNIIVHNTGDGIAVGAVSPITRYNNVWGNGTNYNGTSSGLGDLSVNPPFENESAGDYRLQVDSMNLNAGNPATSYNDRNGTRNDLGVYGGPYAWIAVNSRAFAPGIAQGGFTVSWRGYATDGVQSYDVQYRVGSNGTWNNWQNATTSTSAQFGPTSPIIPILGNTYCFRSRVRDNLGNLELYPAQPDACTTYGTIYLHLPFIRKH